nr:MAG TPA: hypothetical protein [Caudoviricetes sp.]
MKESRINFLIKTYKPDVRYKRVSKGNYKKIDNLID